MKTNAARILDRLKIEYAILEYEVDPDDLAAESTADKLGLPHSQVFKTLVARGDRNGVCLAVIPGNGQLDLKALAKLAGDRKSETVALKDFLAGQFPEITAIGGRALVVDIGVVGEPGGVTALGTKKDYPVYIDESMLTFDKVALSAGKRGLMLWLSPRDYLTATQGTTGTLTKS